MNATVVLNAQSVESLILVGLLGRIKSVTESPTEKSPWPQVRVAVHNWSSRVYET